MMIDDDDIGNHYNDDDENGDDDNDDDYNDDDYDDNDDDDNGDDDNYVDVSSGPFVVRYPVQPPITNVWLRTAVVWLYSRSAY